MGEKTRRNRADTLILFTLLCADKSRQHVNVYQYLEAAGGFKSDGKNHENEKSQTTRDFSDGVKIEFLFSLQM